MSQIKIDMNNPVFQNDFFRLEKKEQLALISTLKKIKQMAWQQVYQDASLNWELILSKKAKSGDRLYSFRFSQKYRAVAMREAEFLRLLTLHTDHDSAYQH